MSKVRYVALGAFVLLLPIIGFGVAVADDMGLKFFFSKGMPRQKVLQFYGQPDRQDEHSMVFFQGGHDVELKIEKGVVVKVTSKLND